ncbi:MAG: hypothetical protein LBV00_09220 [Propionibacteriaceae bacterium]|nr:hypothetical protein [Propionibacteriaceae bacterium]
MAEYRTRVAETELSSRMHSGAGRIGRLRMRSMSLLHCAEKIDLVKHGEPLALIVITGGRFSYRRPDGVVVAPITALGP